LYILRMEVKKLEARLKLLEKKNNVIL
jgi:hypothetical protein